jgi:hypothetical protein
MGTRKLRRASGSGTSPRLVARKWDLNPEGAPIVEAIVYDMCDNRDYGAFGISGPVAEWIVQYEASDGLHRVKLDDDIDDLWEAVAEASARLRIRRADIWTVKGDRLVRAVNTRVYRSRPSQRMG